MTRTAYWFSETEASTLSERLHPVCAHYFSGQDEAPGYQEAVDLYNRATFRFTSTTNNPNEKPTHDAVCVSLTDSTQVIILHDFRGDLHAYRVGAADPENGQISELQAEQLDTYSTTKSNKHLRMPIIHGFNPDKKNKARSSKNGLAYLQHA